ncbi:MAG: hypothetical protein GYB31_17835 [Bacteroidetes bacterium]|nr:hypothetical protein [Bacteroidota bacterium]
MKKPDYLFSSILALLFLGGAQFATAQTETLFNNVEVNGAFGGPMVEFSEINGQTGVSIGGGGALVLNTFFIGGYGIGGQFADVLIEEDRRFIDFGHGGFWLGYTYKPHKLIHLYSDVKLGWGKARIKEFRDDDDEFSIYSDPFFAVTPQIGLELNITDWLKVGFTGGYRFVSGIDELPVGLGEDQFNSPMGTITFRVGGFDEGGWDDDDDDWEEWDN